MQTISYELITTGQVHQEITDTFWGFPEGLQAREATTSPGSSSYFQIMEGSKHIIQIKKRCILGINWIQAVSSQVTQKINVLIRDQDIFYEKTVIAGVPDVLTIAMNIGFWRELNPPYEFTIEIRHSYPIKLLETQRLDITVLVDL